MTSAQFLKEFHKYDEAKLKASLCQMPVMELKDLTSIWTREYNISYSTAALFDRYSDKPVNPYSVLFRKVFQKYKGKLQELGKIKRTPGQLEGRVIEDAICCDSEEEFLGHWFAFDPTQKPEATKNMNSTKNKAWKARLFQEAAKAGKELVPVDLLYGAIAARRRIWKDKLWGYWNEGERGKDFIDQSEFRIPYPGIWEAIHGYRDRFRPLFEPFGSSSPLEIKAVSDLSENKLARIIQSKLWFGQLPLYNLCSRAKGGYWLFVRSSAPFDHRWVAITEGSPFSRNSLERVELWISDFQRVRRENAWDQGFEFIDGDYGLSLDNFYLPVEAGFRKTRKSVFQIKKAS